MKRQIARYRRFAGWDYAKGTSFFITIATAPHRPLFGKIVNGAVALSPLGEKLKEAIAAEPRLNRGLLLFVYVVISGFISKGERAVRDMLCRRRDARFIRMLSGCIPTRCFKPESVYVESFAEGCYLKIWCGNDERGFGRGACLDINEEIIKIAIAGEEFALYWKKEGPHILASNDGRTTLVGHERRLL